MNVKFENNLCLENYDSSITVIISQVFLRAVVLLCLLKGTYEIYI